MKKFILVFGLVLAASAQQPRPRFELLLSEDHSDKRDVNDVAGKFEVWHDRETGQEFICARGFHTGGIQLNYSISCFPTGRQWK